MPSSASLLVAVLGKLLVVNRLDLQEVASSDDLLPSFLEEESLELVGIVRLGQRHVFECTPSDNGLGALLVEELADPFYAAVRLDEGLANLFVRRVLQVVA